MGQSSNANPLLLVAITGVLAASGAVAWLLMAPAPQEAPTEQVAVATAEHAAPASSSRAGPGSEPTKQAGAGVDSAPSPSAEPTEAERARARMARDLERERIWSALRKEHDLEPEAPGSAIPNPIEVGKLPPLDKEYIRSAIKEQLVPVAVDCYNSALQDNPELSGSVILDFVIVGAEDVGGVVEAAEVNEESTLDSPFLRECMRESLMAVTFEPPPDGGRVEVSYPLDFTVE